MARTKVISAKEAAALIKDGDTAKSIVNEVTEKTLLLYVTTQDSRMKEQVVYFTTV